MAAIEMALLDEFRDLQSTIKAGEGRNILSQDGFLRRRD
jgi:hypothetical protein